jgi:hypothetical protein
MAQAKQRAATNPWGVPDPRDADAYPTAASTSFRQWAWEFLRRNPDYRRDWDKHVRPFINDRGEWDEAALIRTLVEFETYVKRAVAAAVARGEPVDKLYTWSSHTEALARKYGLVSSAVANGALDPRLGRAPIFAMDQAVETIEGWGSISLIRTVGFDPQSEFSVRLDPKLPIEPQLAAVRRLLTSRAAKARHSPARKIKPSLEMFPTYLRLLDFEDEKASNSEIGKYLFKDRLGRKLHDSIRKGLEAARNWQSQYLLIAGHAS